MANAFIKSIQTIAKSLVDNAGYDKTRSGQIVGVNSITNTYSVKIDGQVYSNVRTVNDLTYNIHDIVKVVIPCNQATQMYIESSVLSDASIGSKVADAQSVADRAEQLGLDNQAEIEDVSEVANSKNKTYRQDDEPTEGMSNGDIWIDTDDENKMYIWDGTQWVFSGGGDGKDGKTGVSIRNRGEWATGQSYTKGTTGNSYIDIVTLNGNTYICNTSHTSSNTNKPPNATYWVLGAAQGDTGTTGATGDTGATGATGDSITITNTAYAYQLSTSGTTPPTGTWSNTPLAPTTTQFLWTRTIVTYSDGSTTTTYSVGGKVGAQGATGDTGATGATGVAPEGLVEVIVSAISYPSQTATLKATLFVDGVARSTGITDYHWYRVVGTTTTDMGHGSTMSTLSISNLNAIYRCVITWT